MDDIAVLLKHVYLLNRLNGLHVEFLQRSLQLLVIGARGLMDFLLFPPRCSLAPDISCKSALLSRYAKFTPILRAVRRVGGVVAPKFRGLGGIAYPTIEDCD